MVEDPDLPQTSTASHRNSLSPNEHQEVPHLRLFTRTCVPIAVSDTPEILRSGDKLDDTCWLAACLHLAFCEERSTHFRHRVQITLEQL